MKKINLELKDRVKKCTTDFSLAQEVKRNNEEKFRQLAELLNQVFWMIDLSCKSIIYVSPVFEKIWNVSCKDLYSNSNLWFDLIHPEDRDNIYAKMFDQIDIDRDIDYRLVMPNKKIKWMSDHAFTIRNKKHKIYRHAGLSEDITKRKFADHSILKLNEKFDKRVEERTLKLKSAREEAEASNKEKSVFLASMNHELRTPLTAILEFSELLYKDPGLPEKQRDNLRIINHSGSHQRTLINNVLDLSKSVVRRTILVSEEFDLFLFIDDLLDMFKQVATEKDIHLNVKIEVSLPQFIMIGEIKLRQILINLLSNVFKFTERGSVNLQICIDPGFKPSFYSDTEIKLLFCIEDTGIGIPLEDQEIVFKPFEQSLYHDSFRDETSLGLTISKGFTEVLGGELILCSQVGQGTRFQFSIPVESLENSALVPKLIINGKNELLASQRYSPMLSDNHGNVKTEITLPKKVINDLRHAALEFVHASSMGVIAIIQAYNSEYAGQITDMASQF